MQNVVLAMGSISDGNSAKIPISPLWIWGVFWYTFAAIFFLTQQVFLFAVHKQLQCMPRKLWIPAALGQCYLPILVGFFEFWLEPKVIEYYHLMFGTGGALPALTELFLLNLPKGTLVCLSMLLLVASLWGMFAKRNQDKKGMRYWLLPAYALFGILFLVLMPIVLVLPLLYF